MGVGLAQSVQCLTTDWMTWVQTPPEDISSSLCVRTSSEAHPASYPMGTRDPFPAVKHGRDVTLSTHPHLVPRSRMSRCTPLSLGACMSVVGQLFTLKTNKECKLGRGQKKKETHLEWHARHSIILSSTALSTAVTRNGGTQQNHRKLQIKYVTLLNISLQFYF
jgi:hypothetical protein